MTKLSPLSENKTTLIIEDLIKKKDLDSLIDTIIKKLSHVLKSERATFYFYNEDVNELWSYIAKDLEIEEIRVAMGQGVSGQVAKTKKIINIKDASKCKFFNRSIDKKTGFTTKTMLTIPLVNRQHKLLGVLQFINKKNGIFDSNDIVFIENILPYIIISIENILLIQEQETLLRSSLYALSSAIDAKDPTTSGHSHRVAYIAVKIGRAMEFSETELKTLEYASYLHDVGKIGIPESILNKKGRLNNEEYAAIKQHPIHTKQILQNIIFPKEHQLIPEIASCHHEFLDGSGYPLNLKAKEINKFARIITIADIFDALTSFDRPYKKNISVRKSLQILKEEAKKNHLDNKIVNLFIQKKLYLYERRKYKRINLNFSLSYQIIPQRKLLKSKIADDSENSLEKLGIKKSLKTKSKDITAHGLLFTTKQYLAIGTFLDLRVELKDMKLECIGKVAWIEKIVGTSNYNVGIMFVSLSREAKKRIESRIKKSE